MWDIHIRHFGNYLKLERSLSGNSIEAYLRDVEKLKQFMAMRHPDVSPMKASTSHLRDFIEYINELGLSAHSQARILSGVKAFYNTCFSKTS